MKLLPAFFNIYTMGVDIMNFKRLVDDYFPALRHRNFQLFLSGQIISLIGTWMQNTALNWLVYLITKDRFLLGVMNAVQFAPFFLFSLFAGVVIEKYPKRKIIILTQMLQGIAAFILFMLVFTNRINYMIILLIMFCIGTVQTFDNPARQSFVVEMVEGKGHLLNAIALNSAVFNGARLVGPAIAGIIMAGLGPKWCFFLNAVSFIAVLAGLFMMKIDDVPSRKETEKPLTDIKEGLKFIKKYPKLLYTIISVAIINVFCLNFNIIIPPYTREVLGKAEGAYGMLLSALGFGALIGAVLVATKEKKESAVKYQIAGSFGLSLFLVLVGLSSEYYLSLLLLAFNGFFMIMFTTTSNSILQLNSPDYMRGRVMSVYSLIFGGFTPIGSLYAGAVSKYLGSQNAFLVSGIMGFTGFILIMAKRKELK